MVFRRTVKQPNRCPNYPSVFNKAVILLSGSESLCTRTVQKKWEERISWQQDTRPEEHKSLNVYVCADSGRSNQWGVILHGFKVFVETDR